MANHKLPQELLLVIKQEYQIATKELDDRLNNYVKTFGDSYFEIRVHLDEHFDMELLLDFVRPDRGIQLSFLHKFEDDEDFSTRDLVLKKQYVPSAVTKVAKYYKGGYSLLKAESISRALLDAYEAIMSSKNDIIAMCEQSCIYNHDGSPRKIFEHWKTNAVLNRIEKIQPTARMVSGIKKDKQSLYNDMYGLHGSNGSYVENVNPEWSLVIKIRRIAYECDEPTWQTINIHSYMVNHLLPHLGWAKVTEQRLNWLNEKLRGKKVPVITNDMHVPPVYRDFYPQEYEDWVQVLDSIFNSDTNSNT